MLNIGLIGNTKNLEPHVKQLRKIKTTNIIGKSSVGINNRPGSFHFSIPELNRIELIERADIFLIDNSSLIPFSLICDIIKKSKHIFIIEYLDLSIEECSELVKLTNESGSVVQVTNPYFFTPAINWLSKNISKPLFQNISFFDPNFSRKNIFQMLLMLINIVGLNPKKINGISLKLNNSKSGFYNIRLEFGDASVVNINYGSLNLRSEFKIETYSPQLFSCLNFTENTFLSNDKPIKLSNYSTDSEINTFISNIYLKIEAVSTIEDYLSSLLVIQQIDKKISQFTNQ